MTVLIKNVELGRGLSADTLGTLAEMSLPEVVKTLDSAWPGFAGSFTPWLRSLLTITAAYQAAGYPENECMQLGAAKMVSLGRQFPGVPDWHQQVDLEKVCEEALPAMVAARDPWLEKRAQDLERSAELLMKGAERMSAAVAMNAGLADENLEKAAQLRGHIPTPRRRR